MRTTIALNSIFLLIIIMIYKEYLKCNVEYVNTQVKYIFLLSKIYNDMSYKLYTIEE